MGELVRGCRGVEDQGEDQEELDHPVEERSLLSAYMYDCENFNKSVSVV